MRPCSPGTPNWPGSPYEEGTTDMETSCLLMASQYEALPIASLILTFSFLLPHKHLPFSLQGGPKDRLASPAPLLAEGQRAPCRLCCNDAQQHRGPAVVCAACSCRARRYSLGTALWQEKQQCWVQRSTVADTAGAREKKTESSSSPTVSEEGAEEPDKQMNLRCLELANKRILVTGCEVALGLRWP